MSQTPQYHACGRFSVYFVTSTVTLINENRLHSRFMMFGILSKSVAGQSFIKSSVEFLSQRSFFIEKASKRDIL